MEFRLSDSKRQLFEQRKRGSAWKTEPRFNGNIRRLFSFARKFKANVWPEFLEAVPASVDGNRFAPSRPHFREGPIVGRVIPYGESSSTTPAQNLGSIEGGAAAILARHHDPRQSVLGAIHEGPSTEGKVTRILMSNRRQQEYGCLIGYRLISASAPIYLSIFISSV